MYNLLLQLPGITITLRRSHGPGSAEYLPADMDAAVGNEAKGINFIFRNDYDFSIRFEAQAQGWRAVPGYLQGYGMMRTVSPSRAMAKSTAISASLRAMQPAVQSGAFPPP